MAVMPLLATLVSAVFAWSLFRRYRESRRIHALAWGISLTMYASASLALVFAEMNGWGPWLYRTFWLFGALLNVPWLAAGSVSLAWPRLARAAVLAMVVVSAYALVATVAADPVSSVLAREEGIPLGRRSWPPGSNMLALVRVLSIGGWLAVVGIAFWTSRPHGGMRPPSARVRANLLIAAGVTIVALGGFVLGRIGGTAVFSASLAVGVIVMYAGFLFASKAPRYSVADPGDQAT